MATLIFILFLEICVWWLQPWLMTDHFVEPSGAYRHAYDSTFCLPKDLIGNITVRKAMNFYIIAYGGILRSQNFATWLRFCLNLKVSHLKISCICLHVTTSPSMIFLAIFLAKIPPVIGFGAYKNNIVRKLQYRTWYTNRNLKCS